MTVEAARQMYEQAGVGPEDIKVVELHDCFATNELLSYEALGLTPEGSGEKFVAEGDNTYGGRVVTNPVRRAAVQGAPAGCHRSRRCAARVAAQPRPRRRVCRHAVREGRLMAGIDVSVIVLGGDSGRARPAHPTGGAGVEHQLWGDPDTAAQRDQGQQRLVPVRFGGHRRRQTLTSEPETPASLARPMRGSTNGPSRHDERSVPSAATCSSAIPGKE